MPFNNEEEIKLEREKWKLTDEEFEANFDSVFKELVLTGNASVNQNPEFIMVGGQAGGGKSTLVAKELKGLDSGAIVIDQDLLRTKHPRYQQIHDEYTEREEFLLLKRYLDRLVNGILDKASTERYNLILESALRSVSKFIKNTQDLREKRYRTKLSVLAVPPDEANLSMFTRFCKFLAKDGECRRNTRVDEDSVRKIPENIETMDGLGIFDNITISVRGDESTGYMPTQIYSKKETPGIPPTYIYKSTVAQGKIPEDEFERRYTELRAVLEQYGQDVQLKRLDDFYHQFKERCKGEKSGEEKYPSH